MNRWFVWSLYDNEVLAAIVNTRAEVGDLLQKYAGIFPNINVRRCK